MSISRSEQRRDFDVPTRVQILENDADRLEAEKREFEAEARKEAADIARQAGSQNAATNARIDAVQKDVNDKIDTVQKDANTKIESVQKDVNDRLGKILWAIVGLLISITSAVIVYALTTLVPGS